MKNNSGMPVFLGLIGIIVMIAVFSAIGDADRENSKCLYTGCDNERAEDSIYCYRHKSSGKTYSDHHSSFQSSPSPSAQPTESPSYGSTRNNGSSYSKSYSGKGKTVLIPICMTMIIRTITQMIMLKIMLKMNLEMIKVNLLMIMDMMKPMTTGKTKWMISLTK